MDIYLAHAGSVEKFCIEHNCKVMFAPHYFSKSVIKKRIPYALDNGCFSEYKNNEPWKEELFYKILEYTINSDLKPDFVSIPDVVAKKRKSIERSKEHLDKIPGGIKKYFVVQDGMTLDEVHPFFDKIDGLFIGGSVKWKWRVARYWGERAKDCGLDFHIGRVGTIKRLVDSYLIGADSVDGSNITLHRKYQYVHIFRKMIVEQSNLVSV